MPTKKPSSFKPVKDWPKGHRWHKTNRRRCQKWAYGPGRQCEKQAMDGLDSCANHGGKSLKGKASPRYVHGRSSEYAPKGVAAKIEKLMQDPQLLNLSEDAAIATARIQILFEELDSGGGLESWEILGGLYAALVAAMREQDSKAIAENLNRIGEVIQDGQRDYMTWGRIQAAQDHKVKIATAEHKRRVDMQMLLDRGQLLLIIDKVYDIFTFSLGKHLTDDRLARLIISDASTGIRRLVSGDSS